MAALFLKLLNLSVSAGWMILAVILVRAVLRRLPKGARCVLWGLVALRLALPFSIESIFSLLPSDEVLPELVISGPSFTVDSGFRAVDGRVNDYLTSRYYEGVTVPADTGAVWMERMGWIWLAGVCVLVVYAAVSSLRLRWKLRAAMPLEPPVWVCDEIGTPFVFGLVRPRIYLPSGLDSVWQDCVLAHERSHLRHRDHWWKALGFGLLTVYWFHPLVWAAYFLFCRDLELACDERTVRDMNPEQKRSYAHALLACSTGRRLPAAPLAFGEKGVKARIRAVLRSRKHAVWVSAAAAVLCAAVALGFLTVPQAKVSYEHSNAEKLYSYRAQYTGKAPAVGGILSELTFPQELEYQEFSLQTKREPFYIDVEFKAPPQPEMYYFSREHKIVQELNKSACTLFALVHNLRQVRFVLDDGGEEPLMLAFSRESAERVVGVDLWEESATVSGLDRLLGRIEKQVEAAARQEADHLAEMDRLVAEICSSPAYSSAPGDYIRQHQEEYDRLLSYGENTLVYCFDKFLHGGQNGLEGHVMALLCQNILELNQDVNQETGQKWFDEYMASVLEDGRGVGPTLLHIMTDRTIDL